MSTVQQILTNLEITPPPGAWPAIANRLQEEYNTSETVVSQKLQDNAVMPPAAAWEAIAAALPTEQPVTAKVVRLPYRRVRMVAAAAVIGIIGLTAWYFLNYSATQTAPSVVKEQNMVPSVIKKATQESNMLPPIVAPENVQPQELAQQSSAEVNRYARTASTQVNYDYQPEAASYSGVPEAAPVPLTTQKTPSVEAPLIRDANGQIILDRRLITSPDNQYITITGPNGEQTRISAKFLDIISTLNADTDPQDYFNFMMYDNYLWKIRFSEWRNKLMTQSSNVLDILELKEILQEN